MSQFLALILVVVFLGVIAITAYVLALDLAFALGIYFTIPIGLLCHFLWKAERDLKRNQVYIVEGFARTYISWFPIRLTRLQVADQKFHRSIRYLDPQSRYRVYYTPHLKRVLHLERI